ncbi:MAG: apolipoprotein N-acyltransferase [Candidatus Omnitrophota bacterium]|nr:apolipoprotein N-acyltransferase [Candidatus Omnitrophota bacterium]
MLRQVNKFLAIGPWFLGKELLVCFVGAILLVLSFSHLAYCWIFAWFGFVPLFFAVKGKSLTKTFLLFYLAGIIFWTGIIYWLIHVTLLGTIFLILYLALYFGFFGLFYALYAARYTLIIVPCFWVLLEYIRSYLFTGFPWALLGYSQYLNLPVIQIADVTGALGVSFLVMIANVLVYLVVSRWPLVVSKKWKYILTILVICLSIVYGYFRIYEVRCAKDDVRMKISVIQGNIPQELKWDISSRSYILDRYIQLTKKAACRKPELIIWPEASAPGLLGEDDWGIEDIFNLGKEIKTPLLIGSVIKDGQKYLNSALLINKEGGIAGRYDKLHLVPFGEYIPFKELFSFLQTVVPIGDITAGKDYTVLELAGSLTKFSVLICFEDLFPEISRRFVQKGADFLINITNDAWYKKTSASGQHLQASVFRAVENRLYLARCANTGISGFIMPTGKIISRVKDNLGRDIFVSGIDTQEIKASKKPLTFYTRYGDVFILVCFLFVIIYPKLRLSSLFRAKDS